VKDRPDYVCRAGLLQQAMKRQGGAVYQFFQWSKQNAGSATHARLNTQRKLLRAWWTLWLAGEEWEEAKFFSARQT